jgi:hypothetical protein
MKPLFHADDDPHHPSDGGAAFPQSDLSAYGMGPSVGSQSGMSLRDWFAGQAIQGCLSIIFKEDRPSSNNMTAWAYSIADAMLKQREGK